MPLPYRAQGLGGIAGSGVHLNPSGAPDWASILQAGAQGAGSLIHGAYLRKVAERNYQLQLQRMQQEHELRQTMLEGQLQYRQSLHQDRQARLEEQQARDAAKAAADTKENQRAYNALVLSNPKHSLVSDGQGNVRPFDDSVDYTKASTTAEKGPVRMETIIDKNGHPYNYDPTKPIGPQLPPGFQAHIPADAAAATERYKQLTAHETVVTNAEKAAKEIQGKMDKLQAQAKTQGYADLGGAPTGTQLKPGEMAMRQQFKGLMGQSASATAALQKARDDHAALVQGIVNGPPAMASPPKGKITPIAQPGGAQSAAGPTPAPAGPAPIKTPGSTGSIDLGAPATTQPAPKIAPIRTPGEAQIPGLQSVPTPAGATPAPSPEDSVLAGRAHERIQSSGGKITIKDALASPSLTPGAKQVLQGMPEYQPKAAPAVVPPKAPVRPEDEVPPSGGI